MKKVYQDIIDKGHGNCMQAAVASLLDMNLHEVPNFKDFDDWFDVFFDFLNKHGYSFDGSLYNPVKICSDCIGSQIKYNGKNDFDRLEKKDGIDGYFVAWVYSPKYYDPNDKHPTTHAIVIDSGFNIVNPVNEAYENLKKFPLWELLKYNGILGVYLISKRWGN